MTRRILGLGHRLGRGLGLALALSAAVALAGCAAEQPPAPSPVQAVWGTSNQANPLRLTGYLATDQQGNVYAIDTGNSRIQRFGANREPQNMWGTPGTGNGQFVFSRITGSEYLHAGGIAVDSRGLVYVVDRTGRIQVFSGDGKFVARWGGSGSEFFWGSLAVDGQDNIYVYGLDALLRLDAAGTVVAKWPVASRGGLGDSGGLAVSRQGDVYTGDSGRAVIARLDGSGQTIAQWGGLVKGASVGGFSSSSPGSGDGQLNSPNQLAVDSQGRVYVADTYNYRVQVFDSAGRFLAKWGSRGMGQGQFQEPYGIAIDAQDNIYVSDLGGIQKFRLK